MAWFKKKIEQREIGVDQILQALLSNTEIDKTSSLNIPAVAGCVNLIANTVASIPIKLYKEVNKEVIEVIDNRVKLLNDETGDLLDAFQFKKALITDYILFGAGYAYINRSRNKAESLHYVKNSCVSVTVSTDNIFKEASVFVDGAKYRPFEFIKLLRNTQDGISGTGIIDENTKLLSVAYNSLIFEETLVKTGGNKKGFLKAKNKLTQDIMDSLKIAWKMLYGNNSENVMVLNDGIEFTEASNTSVEMQLNENKETNSKDICKILNIPPSLLSGTASDQEYTNGIKMAIQPILKALETALNKDLLLESEKGSFYFACDTKELMKGDIQKRYAAYSEAVRAGWISKNEIRYAEDMKDIPGLDIVTMSLGDVIYDIESKTYFTPNMDSTVDNKMKTIESKVIREGVK